MIFLVILLTIISTVKAAAPPPRCPSNMVQYYQNSHICYWFVSTPASFDDAEKTCVKNGGHLAPVLDQFANFFITVKANQEFSFSNFWIGGKTYNISDTIVWLWIWQNNYFIFSDWSPGQGKPIPNNCVLSNGKTGLWNSTDCSAVKPFVCQIPAVVDVCDPEWSYFKDSGMCYKYMAQPNVTFSEAQNVCVSQNANLTSIHSKRENNFIANMTKDETVEKWFNEGVFIGLHFENSNWKWIDGSIYSGGSWESGNPKDPVERSVVFMNPDGRQTWTNFYPNTTLNRFVCEKKPNLVSLIGDSL